MTITSTTLTHPLPARFCNYGRLLEVMEARGLDGIVAYQRPNVFYLSGYGAKPSSAVHEASGFVAFLLSRHEPDHPVLVVPEFELAQFLHLPTWVDDFRPYANVMLPLAEPADEKGFARFVPPTVVETEWGRRARDRYAGDFLSAVRGAVADLGLDRGRVGYDNPRLAAALGATAAETVDAFGTLKFVRQVKSDDEVELLRRSTHINEQAIRATIAAWDRGVTWQELTRIYNQKAVEFGGFVHDPGGVVVANPAGGDPAFVMDSGYEDFVIEPGMNIMFDCHGTWQHYCWDGGKTWLVGGTDNGPRKRIADATREALDDVREAMVPGTRISELQRIGLKAYQASGVPRPESTTVFFHGLGLEHIDMEMDPGRVDWTLEAGMVVSAHLLYPGGVDERYFLEDIIHVGQSGPERLFSWNNEPFGDGG